jgi:hypothetical protein
MSRRRIEVEISGGVGNQLFQYAAASALCHLHQAHMVVDISWFKKASHRSPSRKFQLSDFIELNEVEVVRSALPPLVRRALCVVRGQTQLKDTQVEPKEFLTLAPKRTIRLRGYWQSEQYFEPISHLLREALIAQRRVALESAAWVSADELTDSVGIHVRRGDYVTSSKTNRFHGVCSPVFYEKGLEYVQRLRDVRKVFVFSDDIEWCRRQLRLNADTFFVEHPGSDTDQLKLMSFCSHHIISNSSFSWWAAWLGRSSNQVVVYPAKWFADGSKLHSMPQGWHSL